MAEELTDAEKAMLKKYRDEEAERRAKLDDADEVQISMGDRSFSGPFRRAREVAKSWGFDLEPPAKPDDEGDKPKETRFGGRRIS